MRQCGRCKQWKDEEEFHWYDKEKGTKQPYCKDCMAEINHARYERKKDDIQRVNRESNVRRVDEAQRYIYEVLSYSRCADCGEYDFTVLTFHHVHGKKKMNVADMASRGYSLDAIKNEIAKCIVLCFSCHMRREANLRGGRFRKFWPEF
jgi:hypothetical protein